MSERPEEYGNTQHKVVDKSKIRGRLSYTEQVLGQLSIWLEKLRRDETLSSDLRTQASMMLDDVWQALRDIHEPTNGLKAILSSMFLPGDIVHHPNEAASGLVTQAVPEVCKSHSSPKLSPGPALMLENDKLIDDKHV